jgi:pimeloyl-ACP methyl ester carboxylesterase
MVRELLTLFTVAIALVILGLIALVELISAWIDRRKFPPPGRLVDIAGARMHVVEQGQGQPAVVLEAGIAATSLSWSLTQPHLAALTTTYSYDRTGLGWSVPEQFTCSLTRMTDDLHALLVGLQVPSPYLLVAHSFGSYIVTEYSRRFPAELAGIVLVDPLTAEEWMNPTRDQRGIVRRGVWFSRVGGVLAFFGVLRACLWMLERGNREAPRGVLRIFGAKATETVEHILGELAKLPPDVVRLIRARWSTPKFFWTMASYIQAVPRCAAELHARTIPREIPVTVLSGAHQPQVRLEEHAAIASRSVRGRHVIANASAHWIHLDQPELVAEAVGEMVRAVPYRMPCGVAHEEGRRA